VSTRDRLSVEAARLFAERGYHGTSIGDLADALGIRKASVYSHIKGKEDLLAEIALAGAQAFHAALDGVSQDAAPDERLRLALHAHLGLVRDQLDVATVWLQEWRYMSEPARTTFLAERRRYERRIRRMFEAAVAGGTIRRDLDLRHAVLMFLSVGNWAYTWMTHKTDVRLEGDAFWSALTRGLAET
jgi:TetR/AcrR family transcriptional regulator, cholesterol catabolism regulator